MISLALKEELQVSANPVQAGKQTKNKTPTDVITDWLAPQEKDEIIRQFVGVLTQDRQLKREWLLKAETGLGHMDKSAIKKQITAAFPVNRHIYEYAKVRAYFGSATMVLHELEQPLYALPPDVQIKLVEHAFSVDKGP